ncbi:MAG: succinylglutamate desuccinylase/aspartoacylase family protein [Balneolaceae bacterium]|nr:succinylglutamate desuccinylase/aspartoacylase family protein [Balneolaceae bacterium]
MNRREHSSEPSAAVRDDRIIGKINGTDQGPIIIAFSGVHGNEKSGVIALEKVFEMVDPSNFRGTFIGIKANLPALERNVRYVDEDLNRIWFPSIVDKIKRCPIDELESVERMELKKTLQILEQEIPTETDQTIVIIDLHSFSAEGCMFAITPDKEDHTRLLRGLNIPMIFGIEEALRGTALRYFEDQGYISFALEGGNHENEVTIYNNTAALLMLLQFAGNITEENVAGLEKYSHYLDQHTQHVPDEAEFVYQHIIETGDEFEMREGFKNFQQVKEGEWLANDKNGKIRAQCDGFIIMPLYQKQGNDGFFIVRELEN